jgi:hypothetical protein
MDQLKLPKGSEAKAKYHLGQLRKMFARANDHAFLQMIWAVDALQDDRADVASAYLTSPKEAAQSTLTSPYAIHRWELETLLIQLFLTPKQEIGSGPKLALDCTNFESIRETTNRVRKLEDVESAVYLKVHDVLMEIHRIAQRQFHWQHGYYNLPQLYRYSYIYGQGKCGEYFEHTYGISITDLTFVGTRTERRPCEARYASARTFDRKRPRPHVQRPNGGTERRPPANRLPAECSAPVLFGSFTTKLDFRSDVRFTPGSDRIADIAGGPVRAKAQSRCAPARCAGCPTVSAVTGGWIVKTQNRRTLVRPLRQCGLFVTMVIADRTVRIPRPRCGRLHLRRQI